MAEDESRAEKVRVAVEAVRRAHADRYSWSGFGGNYGVDTGYVESLPDWMLDQIIEANSGSDPVWL